MTNPSAPPRSVAFVSNTAWSIYNFRKRIIEELLSSGFRIVCIAPTDAYSSRLREMGCEVVHIDVDSKGTNPLRDIRLTMQLVRIFRTARPGFSFNYTIKCSIYATLAGTVCGVTSIPVITGTGYVFASNTWITRIAKMLYRAAFWKVSEVWFLNRDDRQLFNAEGILPEAKANVIPGGEGVDVTGFDVVRMGRVSARVVAGSGIDTNEFKPIDYFAEARSAPSFSFLLVARMIWEKGIREYVEAARVVKRLHPHASFFLLGSVGVDNPSAIPIATIRDWEAEGVVKWLGTTDDVASVMMSVDAVVLPSYYREGIPRSLLEASSLEIPIITTDSVGCRETVDDGVTGLLVRPRDSADLAAKMVTLLNMSPPQLAKMGRAGRDKMIREFDVSHVIQAYREVVGLPRETIAAGNPTGKRNAAL